MLMKSFWKFATFILAGAIGGLILADKLFMGAEAIYKGNFRFKQKGKGNVQTPTVNVTVPEKSRKSDRILEKLERQKARAQKKIDKQHN